MRAFAQVGLLQGLVAFAEPYADSKLRTLRTKQHAIALLEQLRAGLNGRGDAAAAAPPQAGGDGSDSWLRVDEHLKTQLGLLLQTYPLIQRTKRPSKKR